MGSHLSKVTETFGFCRESKHLYGMFRKVALLEILKSRLLTREQVYSKEFECFFELLTKFLKVDLKLTENFQEVISDAFLIRNLQTCKMRLSALHLFKTPEIRSTVEFLSSEAGANGFSKE